MAGLEMLSTRSPLLSVIVCVKDNHDAFRKTLISLLSLPGDLWELIISDSSQDRGLVGAIIAECELESPAKYVWSEPRGVYPAINEGLCRVSGDWVYVLHSGDRLVEQSVDALISEMKTAQTEIVLFRTLCMRNNKPIYKSRADNTSIFWPHQGVVIRAEVHQELGTYDERYKILADQIFLHAARARYRSSLRPLVIAEYDLSGISSSIDLHVRKEFWLVRKIYGVDSLTNFFSSYVRPIIRGFIDRFLSPRIVDAYLKRQYGD